MNLHEMHPEACAILRSLKLPPPSQFGIIVPHLSRAAEYYGSLLNIKKWYRTKIISSECFYRGRPISQKLDIAVGYAGGIQYELIQQESPEESIYNTVFSSGQGGFHHIGISLRGLDKKLSLLEEAGIKPLQSGIIRFGRAGVTRYAYLDTMERAGFILELIETRAFGIYSGMSGWVVSLGTITGDTEHFKIGADAD